MLKKKMHEIDSTLQSKDESDHFSFFLSFRGSNGIGATVFP